MTYKPNSDVIEEAPGLLLLQELSRRGVAAVAYDPAASEKALATAGVAHLVTASAGDCVARADVVAIATAWPEFGHASALSDRARTVIDCWRIMPELATNQAVNYVTLGVGPIAS